MMKKDPHFAKPDDPCYSSFEGQLQNNTQIIKRLIIIYHKVFPMLPFRFL